MGAGDLEYNPCVGKGVRMIRFWKKAMVLFSLLLTVGAMMSVTAWDAGAGVDQPKTVWACSACDFQQADAGSCPTCKADLAQYNVLYDCLTCGMTQVVPGNCSMCGTPLKEKKVPTA